MTMERNYQSELIATSPNHGITIIYDPEMKS